MDVDKELARLMGMNDEKWLRHVNPWSVWTRLATVPAFALAVYARVWLGWWSFPPIGCIAIFLWLNTRIFPRARGSDRWETRAILGERVWLERKTMPIPDHHRRATRWILAGSPFSVVPMIIGLAKLEPWATALGVAGIVFGQLWFLDRLAWLYGDVVLSKPACE